MRTAIIGISLLVFFAIRINAAQAAAATRVPPPGIAITEKDRAELRAGADELARQIAALRASAKTNLLPDVEIFHKAVDWALRYGEFYRSNEVGLARGLLRQGTERARQLREGKLPWLNATGLVVRGYVSKIDGSVQPYGLVVPASFSTDTTKTRRMDVWLHGRDNNLTELKFISDRQRSYGEFTPADTIVLHPYGRYCNAFKFAGEVDVFEAMEHVKKWYRIDERRIALRGFSMGGAGVWHLAAHHPDVWAVAQPGAGFAETAEYQKLDRAKVPPWEQKLWKLYDATDYAANFFNLPVIAYNGTEDPQRQAADVMEREMKAEGLALPRVWGTNVPHRWTPEAKKEVSAFVDRTASKGKEQRPTQIHLTTRTLQFNRAPRLTVLALEEHWKRADVKIELRESETLTILTTNISRFSFTWKEDETPKRISIDGQDTGFAMSCSHGWCFGVAQKGSKGKWGASSLDLEAAPFIKQHGLQGPIDAAFMNGFLVVRPTGKAQNAEVERWLSSQLAKATNDWRAQFRGDARVEDDSQVTDADIAEHNLVLFGDPKSNRLLARIAGKLPIRWTAEAVQVGDKSFSAATHVPVLIFPNPLNPRRYVVLNSGFTFAEAGRGSNAQQTPKLPDYAVLDVANNGAVVLADFFDEQWRLRVQ